MWQESVEVGKFQGFPFGTPVSARHAGETPAVHCSPAMDVLSS
jgi:hypothetical protein